MKIDTSILAIIFCLILTSCGSDQLTKRQAEKLLDDCQGTENAFKTQKYTYGKRVFTDSEKSDYADYLKHTQELEKAGMVKIDLSEKNTYLITLTPKGQEYLVGRVDDFFGRLTGNFKASEYELKEIKEIHEIPESNEARVKITLSRFNETPFFEEASEESNPKEIDETLTYRKTNEGWKLCD